MDKGDFHVIAVGASAGGLEPLQVFFDAAPTDAGHAYVVLQHLSPDFKSLMPELLQRHTAMKVVSVTQDVPLEPNTVFVMAAGLMVTLDGHTLRTHPRQGSSALEFPISTFFESLAELGPRGVAIVLSGTGSDGTVGAQRVHRAGGLVIAQSPGTARFEAMPRGVIDSGCCDIVTAPEDMSRAIAGWISDPVQGRHFGARPPAPDPQGHEYGPILAILSATYNIDFEHYKPGTIVRRIERRLTAGPVPLSAKEYAERLATDRDELDRLISDVLVGVTRFFRDEEDFLQLQTTVLEPLVESLPPQEELRIWCCGCSTGEEAYSLAMLACETFERQGKRARLRVLATDLHGAALQVGSQGTYPPESLECVPEDLRRRYFVLQPSGLYKVSEDLRRVVIYSAHNVLQDAAFTRIDLVTCRNMMIYFQPQAQKRALAAFHFALRDGGALFLGKSEGISDLPGAFEPVARASHLYRKLPGTRLPAELRGPMLTRAPGRAPLVGLDLRAGKRLDELLMQGFMPDSLLVNARFELVHVYGQAARYLHMQAGRFAGEVSALLNPPLRTAVMLTLRKVAQSGQAATLADLPHEASPDARLRISVDAIADRSLPQPHYLVRLVEEQPLVPRLAGGAAVADLAQQAELQAQQVEELEAELARMREALQNTIEELESANEELQAGNEELMAANEELQSTNEELHAVNEELYSVNAEHESKINELRETSADLTNLIRATELAILFLDRELHLRMFTPPAAVLFPLQPRDIGRDLRDFMPREADDRLFSDLAAVAAGQGTIDHEFPLSDGRWLRRRVAIYRDSAERNAGLVLTYVDISEQVQLRELSKHAAAEEMLRIMSEALPHQLWHRDADNRLIWASAQIGAYLGVPTADVVADESTYWRSIHPDDSKAWQDESVATMSSERFVELSYRLRRHDGVYRWHKSHSVIYRQADGRIVGRIGIAMDVHDQVEATKQLKRQDDFLRLVTDNVSGMVGYYDKEYVNHFSNRHYLEWLGKPTEEVIGKSVAELLGPERWTADKALFDATLGGQSQHFERDLPYPDGTIRHSLVHYVPDLRDGVVQGMFVTVSDASPLYEARRSLETLLETLPLAVLVVGREGKIVRANAEAARLTGLAPAALSGASIESLIPEDYRSRHARLRQAFMLSPDASGMGKDGRRAFPLLRHDGSSLYVEVGLAPCNYMGQPVVIAMLRDARSTALLQVDEARRADTARSSFLATMSHEIRTPLNAIMGMTQLLQLDSPNPCQLGRLRNIEDASKHLLELVNDVLDLAQIESGHLHAERSSFSVADVVERSVALVADRARLKHLALTQHIAADVPPLLVGDARRIEQILVNLLSNAVKFTPEGKIEVRVSGRAFNHESLVLRVEVEDSGIGIAPEQIARLFRPFEQIDQKLSRHFGGSGLGLAISRHLANAMGGDCGVRSVPGAGSTFWFTVLAGMIDDAGGFEYEPPTARAADPAALAARLNSNRLLVVEDDRVNQMILVEMLRGMGATQVDVAENGQEAIDATAAHEYALVFMDMQLPGIDGLEATRQITARGGDRRPVILALTANVMPQDVQRCLDAGMHAHLGKPVSKRDLEAAVMFWLEAPRDGATGKRRRQSGSSKPASKKRSAP